MPNGLLLFGIFTFPQVHASISLLNEPLAGYGNKSVLE